MDPTAAPDPQAWNYPPAQRHPAPPSPYPTAAPKPPAPQYQVPPQGWATALPQYAVVARENRGVNGFAIASLVLGICGGLLLSVIFGIVALVQIKNNGGRGKGIAIAGLAVSGLWVLLVGGAAALGALDDSTHRDPVSGQVTQPGSVLLIDLSPGDCVTEQLTSLDEAYALTVVPCTEPHRAEVVAVEPMFGDTFPGTEVVNQTSDELCQGAAARYAPTAVATGELELTYFTPTRETWAQGDKSVVCLLHDPAGTRTGSVAG